MARLCFEKNLSPTDAKSNLEISKRALHLPNLKLQNEDTSMFVRDQNGCLWEFEAPEKPSSGRRTLRGEWPKFASIYGLKPTDTVRLYQTYLDTTLYLIEFEKTTLSLF